MITGNEQINPIVVPGFTYADGSYESPSIKGGLTIRQHFAAMAMQGIVSNEAYQGQPDSRLVKDAVTLADALIAELNKEKNGTK